MISLNDNIDKIMKNMELSTNILKMFKILRREYNFKYVMSFESDKNDLYVIDNFINMYPNEDRFIFLCDIDLMNYEEDTEIIVRYGIGNMVLNMIRKVANELGLIVEVMEIGKLKLKNK